MTALTASVTHSAAFRPSGCSLRAMGYTARRPAAAPMAAGSPKMTIWS
jgi:hypothetical protein